MSCTDPGRINQDTAFLFKIVTLGDPASAPSIRQASQDIDGLSDASELTVEHVPADAGAESQRGSLPWTPEGGNDPVAAPLRTHVET